ncbi:MAG: M16 family metallopeptidase [Candidatus Muiribacteriota bacterium]
MKKFFLLLLILGFFLSVNAFEGQEKIVELENGLTVVLKETHIVPMVSMQAWVRAGSIHEGDLFGTGIAHYFEHMLFKGTKRRGPGEIPQEIHRAGGSDFNAYTTFDRTVYHFTILNEYTDTGLDVLADMFRNSVFDEEEANKESKVILKEINQSVDEPDSNLYWRLMKTAYQKHPFRNPILGYEELFKTLEREDVDKFYKTFYSPSNVVLSLVGSFQMDEMVDKVRHYFGDWERQIVPPSVIPEESKQNNFRFVEYEDDVNNSRLFMGYQSVDMYDDDAYALDCLGSILGSGNTSRLYKRLVEEDRIAHTAVAGSWTPKYPGIFQVRATFDVENYTKVRFAIQDEINRFKYEKVTSEELERVKNNVLSATVYNRETISQQADGLAYSYFYTGTLNSDQRYIDGINRVTAEDIKRVAQKYLNMNNLSMIHMKPQTEKTEIKREKTKTAHPDVELKKLDNGIKVILMEDSKLPMVSVNAGFFGGLIVEDEEKHGISKLATSLLTEGTKSYSKEEIRDIVTQTGSSINASSGNNSMFVSAKTLTDNLDKIWDVYTSIISESKFSDEDFGLVRDRALATIRQNKEDINHINNILSRSKTFDNHPYRFDQQGTVDSISAISADDVREFISTHIVPDNMTIAVVGDFRSEDMFKRINSTLGRMPDTGYELKEIPKPSSIIGQNKYVEHMPERRQSIVRMSFRGVDFNNDDKYVLSVISNILSGLGSRLFENLRSKHSLAYSVYAYPWNGINTGAFIFYIATIPEKRDFALELMKEEIEKLQNEPVSSLELERAINRLIGQDSSDIQETLGMAQSFVLDEMYGIGYQETFEFAEKIRQISKEDIMRVANKYFDLNNYVIGVVEPPGNK